MDAIPLRPPEPDLDEPRAGLTPTWHITALLVLIVVTLGALAAAPYVLIQRNKVLRQELSRVIVPLGERVSDMERITATQVAAARGFALTGDPVFIDRFVAGNDQVEGVVGELRLLAPRLGGELEAAVERLIEAHAGWDAINFGNTQAEFQTRLPEHQSRYEDVMRAAQRLDDLLADEDRRQRHRIERAEDVHAAAMTVLALVALLGAGASLWLAYRLRESGRSLLRRAQEEQTLRQIAQSMAAAEDLRGALRKVAEAVAEALRLDGVRLERVDEERGEVEVIAVVGEDPHHEGDRLPYRGSSAAEALAQGASGGARGAVGRTAPVPDGAEARLLVVPLLSEGEALGAFELRRVPPRPAFDGADARRAYLFAALAALALRRLRLAEEVRQKGAALQATAEELRALNETLEERVRERTAQVQDLSRALTLTEQRERREVAQVLHDDLQQVLYGLQLGLKTLERRAPELGGDAVAAELRSTHDLVGEAITSTRRLTVDLSPPVLAGEGLVEALHWLATHVEERFGLAVRVRAPDGLTVPADDMRVLLFQAVREFLFNAVKHAQAQSASIALAEEGGVLSIEVSDDGVGFDAAEATGTLGGFGLRRARERLSLFGGALEMASEPGHGTRVTVSLPVDRLREHES